MSYTTVARTVKGAPIFVCETSLEHALRRTALKQLERTTYDRCHLLFSLDGSRRYDQLVRVVDDPNNRDNKNARTINWDSDNTKAVLDILGHPVVVGHDESGEPIVQELPMAVFLYRMEADRITAEELGDEIQWQENADGTWTSIQISDSERLAAVA